MKRSSVLGVVTSLPQTGVNYPDLSLFSFRVRRASLLRKKQLEPVIIRQLNDNDLEARALGRSDYATELPFRQGLLIASSLLGGDNSGFRAVPRERWIEKTGNSCRG